jgi:hypothetical protein
VRVLMNNSAAICALVRPRATNGVFGGGGQAHLRAAFLCGASLAADLISDTRRPATSWTTVLQTA